MPPGTGVAGGCVRGVSAVEPYPWRALTPSRLTSHPFSIRRGTYLLGSALQRLCRHEPMRSTACGLGGSYRAQRAASRRPPKPKPCSVRLPYFRLPWRAEKCRKHKLGGKGPRRFRTRRSARDRSSMFVCARLYGDDASLPSICQSFAAYEETADHFFLIAFDFFFFFFFSTLGFGG